MPLWSCTNVQRTKKPVKPKLMVLRNLLQFKGSSGSVLGTGWRMTSVAGPVTTAGQSVCGLYSGKCESYNPLVVAFPEPKKCHHPVWSHCCRPSLSGGYETKIIALKRLSITGMELVAWISSPLLSRAFVRIYTTATAEAVSAVFCTLSAHPYLEPRIACFRRRTGRIGRIAN